MRSSQHTLAAGRYGRVQAIQIKTQYGITTVASDCIDAFRCIVYPARRIGFVIATELPIDATRCSANGKGQ